MSRTSLVALLALPLFALPQTARAADPGTGGAAATSADPFAPAPEPKQPTSIEDQEAAVLGGPTQPGPATEAAPPAEPRPAAPARRPPPPRPRRAQSNDAEGMGAAASPDNPGGLAIELSTTGFASGPLVGGLFVGGRVSGDMIVGGFFNYGLASLSTTPPGPTGAIVEVTTSTQVLRLGGGLRYTLARSADRRVDLFGAVEASFDHKSAEVVSTSGSGAPTESVSASGFSFAMGPGLRLWVHEQIAIGYVARFRLGYLSGDAPALTDDPSAAMFDATVTSIGFDGTFQLLGVF